tara:strand:- start:3637 stop:5385 length:1749 start_codon:yes stop_codon:yes gene_type:complete
MKNFKFTTTFSSIIKSVIPEEKDKYLAIASLADIGAYIPDVDADKNIDLLPVAFNAFVANRVNKNGDVVDTQTAIEIAKSFANKPINIEHNRTRVIGVVLTAGYSEFGTDKPLSEEDIINTDTPFNVTLGGVVWKVVNSDVADRLEDSSDPTSDNYLGISASWELGFSDYDLALTVGDEKNLENAEIIDDDDQIDELKSNLRSLGGEGVTDDGHNVYRKVIGNVVPLGIGLTETPAADVIGVLVKSDTEEIKLVKNVKSADDKDAKEISEKTQNELKTNLNKQNNISHSKENNVKENKDTSIMKIEKLSDITNESLKEIEASQISDFIEDELKKASEQYLEEKAKVDTALQAAEEKSEALVKDQEQLKSDLASVSEELDSLKAEKIEREKQQLFSQRMATLDEKYALTDEDREVIASDIKELDEEAYSAWESKMGVLLSSKEKQEEVVASLEEGQALNPEKELEKMLSKAMKMGLPLKAVEALVNKLWSSSNATQETAEASDEAKETETEEASAEKTETEKPQAEETKAEEPVDTAEDVVDEAIEAAEETTESVPVTSEASEPTVYEKYKNAFSMEGFEIKL